MAQSSWENALLDAAQAQGLSIPQSCLDGVRAHLQLFLHQAAIMAAADDPTLDPAELLLL